jgi:hypothetical protein
MRFAVSRSAAPTAMRSEGGRMPPSREQASAARHPPTIRAGYRLRSGRTPKSRSLSSVIDCPSFAHSQLALSRYI